MQFKVILRITSQKEDQPLLSQTNDIRILIQNFPVRGYIYSERFSRDNLDNKYSKKQVCRRKNFRWFDKFLLQNISIL